MSTPLEGVLVADFSRVLAGPLCTTWLADLGARVIKVERTGTGDDTRDWGPPWAGEDSSYFHCANRSKESIELDLTSPKDRATAFDLASRADVLVENFRDGTMATFGLDYTSVSEANPGVVYCSVTGFGPGHDTPLVGYDLLVQAVGGLMSITGDPAGDPTRVGFAVVDVLTSKDAVIGVLAALRERESSGLGQHVEVNLLSTLLSSLANQASGFLATGSSPQRLGNAHPSISPYESYEGRNGQLIVCCGTDQQFVRLCDVLGLPSLPSDARFVTNADRVANRPALRALITAAISTEDAEIWAQRVMASRVPAGTVADVQSAFELATELGLRPTVDVGPGAPSQVRNPVSFSRTPVVNYLRPPLLGEHTHTVTAWLEKETP